VVLSSENILNFKGNGVAPPSGCRISPPWNISKGITYQMFLSEKQILDTIISVRPFSSFTQTSESR
jgi:hypothetical protein